MFRAAHFALLLLILFLKNLFRVTFMVICAMTIGDTVARLKDFFIATEETSGLSELLNKTLFLSII